ncbi:hypothetical protein R3P38DRAFT_3143548, partial [Favolaschia claudopus]
QRFPIAKWISFNVFLWSVSLCCHVACHNFAGLMIVRTLLGAIDCPYLRHAAHPGFWT